MINKLRKRIFWMIQGLLTTIVIGIIIIYTSLNYKETIKSSTMFLDRIAGDDIRKTGMFGDFNNSIETDDIYKIFIDSDFNVIQESNNVNSEIENYAIKVSKLNKEEGFIGKYIYKIRKITNKEISVILMENEDIINGIKIKIYSSIVLSFVFIIVIYFLAKKISEIIVKPVEETLDKQKQFISDASHELKTPLAVIEANSEVLEDKVGNNKWITYIQNEVQSMNKLVNDLLFLAKLEHVKNDNYYEFNLTKQIEMTVSIFESMIFEKQIELITNIQKDIMFHGEKEDIKQVLSILIDNAIKHTNKDKKIIINSKKDKNEIIIEVNNEGEEINKEDQLKIFERFYRVDKARNRSEKRYGLGLAIAKQIIESYKGSISVNCNNGITSFIVKIPI